MKPSTLLPLLSSLLWLSIATSSLLSCQQGPLRPAVVEPAVPYVPTATADAALSALGWKKTFEDNFERSPTHPTNPNWTIWVGGAFNQELQLYTARPANLTVIQDPDQSANHLLQLKAVREQLVGPKYRKDVDSTPTAFGFSSARIESKAMFTPPSAGGQVRIAGRLKLPSGYGMWPSFWSQGNQWPTNGGITILQARGHQPYAFQTCYFYDSQTNHPLVAREESQIRSVSKLTDQWHIYEVIWAKDSLTFLLDGQVVATKQGSLVPQLSGRLQRLTLNLAVGGDYFGVGEKVPTADQIPLLAGEGIMAVDWVKVYVKE
ncbi:glycoside hydrolase family 16 protein [Spirosoma pulveris]